VRTLRGVGVIYRAASSTAVDKRSAHDNHTGSSKPSWITTADDLRVRPFTL